MKKLLKKTLCFFTIAGLFCFLVPVSAKAQATHTVTPSNSPYLITAGVSGNTNQWLDANGLLDITSRAFVNFDDGLALTHNTPASGSFINSFNSELTFGNNTDFSENQVNSALLLLDASGAIAQANDYDASSRNNTVTFGDGSLFYKNITSGGVIASNALMSEGYYFDGSTPGTIAGDSFSSLTFKDNTRFIENEGAALKFDSRTNAQGIAAIMGDGISIAEETNVLNTSIFGSGTVFEKNSLTGQNGAAISLLTATQNGFFGNSAYDGDASVKHITKTGTAPFLTKIQLWEHQAQQRAAARLFPLTDFLLLIFLLQCQTRNLH